MSLGSLEGLTDWKMPPPVVMAYCSLFIISFCSYRATIHLYPRRQVYPGVILTQCPLLGHPFDGEVETLSDYLKMIVQEGVETVIQVSIHSAFVIVPPPQNDQDRPTKFSTSNPILASPLWPGEISD